MKQLQLKQIGSLIKVHGINGELVLRLNDNLTFDLIEELLNEGDAVFVERDGIPVPFFISENGIREHTQQSLLLKFDDIDNTKAPQFVASKVFLDTAKLESSLPEDIDDASEWVGFQVTDLNGTFKGTVLEFVELKGNPVLNIKVGDKTMYLPLLSDFITSIDEDEHLIILDLPDGYLEAML